MTTPLPQGVGFTSASFFKLCTRENENLSFLDFFQGPWDWKRSFAVERAVVRTVLMNRPKSLGIQPTIAVSINGGDGFECGLDQIFYLEDGTEITPADMVVGMRLLAVIPNTNNFSGDALGLVAHKAGAHAEVTATRHLPFPSALYHSTVEDTLTGPRTTFMLSCGVVAKALTL